MRSLLFLALIAAATTGCGSVEYRDTNNNVNANPMCASDPDRPGEPVALACERKTETVFSTERKEPPLDLSGKSGKDDPHR